MPISSFPTVTTGVTVQTATAGALSGDGSALNKLAVGVDGVTIDVNGSNQLEVLVSGEIGGSDTQVQFNDSGAFGGDAGLTYNKTTDALTVAGVTRTAGVGVGTAGVAGAILSTGPLFLDASLGTTVSFAPAGFGGSIAALGYTGTDPLNPIAGDGVVLGGTWRVDALSGAFYPASGDNVTDIGFSDGMGGFLRPRTGYFATSLNTPLVTRDSGDLTLSTTTSGQVKLDGIDGLNLSNIPASSVGLAAGDVYQTAGALMIKL